MKTDSDHLDIEHLLLVLRRRGWVIALLTALVAGASFVFSEHQTKQYTATASVLFEQSQINQQASGLQNTQLSPAADPTIMATNVQLLTRQAGVAAKTALIVGHGLTPSGVSSSISASEQGQTDIATLSAVSTSPVLAASIANTFTNQFIASHQAQQHAAVAQALALVQHQVAALSPQQLAGTSGQALLDREESLRILGKLQDSGVQLVTAAGAPTSPTSPKVARDTVLGLLLGLLLGLSAAVLLERLDRRMKSVEDLEAAYQLPLLAAIPQSSSYVVPGPENSHATRGDTEVFRLLRAYLRYFNVDRELRSLLIVSSAPGDGKTTVARNLAEAAQETGTKTLLIEADLRRPNMATYYRLNTTSGLAELLIGSVDPPEAIQSIPIATRVNGSTAEVSLDVLLAGHPPPNPAELLQSKAMADVLSWAAEHYELVVIDTPPLSVVADAVPLLAKVDGVVVVSQLGKNTHDAAAFLRERLAGVNAPLLGVVANAVKAKDGASYGYGYGYYGADSSSLAPQDGDTASRSPSPPPSSSVSPEQESLDARR
jgi:capsular exopolysaccharide synthesis family protein